MIVLPGGPEKKPKIPAVPTLAPVDTVPPVGPDSTLAHPPKPKADDWSILDQLVQSRSAAQDEDLRRGVLKSQKMTPDQQARALTLSQKHGIPLDTTERQPALAEQRDRAEQLSYDRLVQTSPGLAEWMRNPVNATLASDDLDSLRKIGLAAQAVDDGRPKPGFWRNLLKSAAGSAGAGIESGIGHALETVGDMEAEYGIPNLLNLNRAVGGLIKNDANNVQDFYATRVQSYRDVNSGQDLLDYLGSAMGQSVGSLAAITAGTAAAGPVGGVAAGGLLNYGDVRGELEDLGMEAGPTKNALAIALTIPIAILDEITPGQIASKLAKRGVAHELVREAATYGLTRRVAAAVLKSAAEEGGTEVAQELIQYVGTRVGTGQPLSLGDATQRAIDAGVGGLLGGGVMTFASETPSIRHQMQSQAFYTALGTASKESKLLKRMPEKMQEAVAAMTKDGPVETLYVPAKEFTEYFQSDEHKVADVGALVEKLTGSRAEYDEAMKTGGDFAIPTARYAATLAASEHHDALSEILRTDPTEMNARDAKAWREGLTKKSLEGEPKTAQELDREAAAEHFVSQLTAAGVSEEEARANAEIQARSLQNIAAGVGLTAQQVIDRYGFEVEAPDLAAAAPAPAGQTEHAQALQKVDDVLYQAITQPPVDATVEAIAAPAVQGTSGTLYGPAAGREGHASAYEKMLQAGEPRRGAVQGFVTSTGRFVNREQALDIAVAAGQITQEKADETRTFWEEFLKNHPREGAALGTTGLGSEDVNAYAPVPPNITLNQSATIRAGRETLKKFGLDPAKRYTNRQVAAALEARQRAKYGTIARDDRSAAAATKIAKWIAAEVAFELENPEQSGAGWYTEKFQAALNAMGQKFPELLTDPEARHLMTALIAITSDGAKVGQNFAMAMSAYETWQATGRFETQIGHNRAASLDVNLAHIQRMHGEMGAAGMREFLTQEMTIKELRKIGREMGLDLQTDYEGHVVMPMAALVFGPKLGAFYANLMGKANYLTMDRWWSRTFNRYRGTLLDAPTKSGIARFRELLGQSDLSDEEVIAATVPYRNSYAAKNFKQGTEMEKAANTLYKAAYENLNDAPFNAGDRTFMLATVAKARKLLERQGHSVTAADLQAILWYYEKKLYGQLTRSTRGGTVGISYADAARAVIAGGADAVDRAGGPDGSALSGAGPEADGAGVFGDADAASASAVETYNQAAYRGGVEERRRRYSPPAPETNPLTRDPASPEAQRAETEHVTIAFGSPEKAGAAATELAKESPLVAQFRAKGLPVSADRIAAVRKADRRAWVDLRGKVIDTPQKAAQLLHAFRNPRMERMHVLLLDDNGTVLSHSMETSGAIGYVQFGENWEDEIAARAKRVGATNIIISHNHPSGDPNPSEDDRQFTMAIGSVWEQRYGLRLTGHLVIDHTEARWISPSRYGLTEDVVKIPRKKSVADWSTTGRNAGHIGSPVSVATMLAGVLPERGFVALFLDSQNKPIALEPHTEKSFATIHQWLGARQRANAARRVVLAARGDLARQLAQVAGMAQANDTNLDEPHWARHIVDVMSIDERGAFVSYAMKGAITTPNDYSSTPLPSRRVFDATNGTYTAAASSAAEGPTFSPAELLDPSAADAHPTVTAPGGGDAAAQEAGAVSDGRGVALSAQSPAFQRWFGDSKVVDEAGRPRVMYHGSGQSFDVFKGKQGTRPGLHSEGIWFTGKPNGELSASTFAEYADGNPQVYPVFLSIKNPKGLGQSEMRHYTIAELKAQGYDGVHDLETGWWVAFDPEQVKSAIGNRGTFDATDPVIYNQSAYHGTPHNVDRFSIDHIGTGEGAQTYGWGLYFASNKKIAEWYRNSLARKRDFGFTALTPGENLILSSEFPREARQKMSADPTLIPKWIAETERLIAENEDDIRAARDEGPRGEVQSLRELRKQNRRVLRVLTKLRDSGDTSLAGGGKVYTVEIPHDDEYLLYDKPLDQQPPAVEKALDQILAAIPRQVAKLDGFTAQTFVWDNARGAYNNFANKFAEELARTGDVQAALRAMDDEVAQRATRMPRTGGVYAAAVQEIRDAVAEHQPKLTVENLEHDRSALKGRDLYDMLQYRMGGARQASEFLLSHGIAGTKYLDASSRDKGEGSHNYVLFDDSRISITSAEQRAAEGPRGRIRIGDSYIAIDLFASRDLSTVLHETGHAWLKLMQDFASDPKATPQLKADYAEIRRFVGATGDEPFTREQHELWARATEQYLREGKAPTNALAPVFAKFRAWLTFVYRQARDLNVTLTPEIRQVFDRILASEDEIRQAQDQQGMQPFFDSEVARAVLGERRAADYDETVQQARSQAETEIATRLMDDVRREEGRVWQAEREEVRTEVAAEVNQDPTARALANLTRGEQPDGTPLPDGVQRIKLDRAAVLSDYAHLSRPEDQEREFLGRFPRGVMTKEDGMHPQQAAEQLGLKSGDELLQALLTGEPPRKTIERVTDERMKDRHPELLTSTELPVEAMKAVHNEKRSLALAQELKILVSQEFATFKGLVSRLAFRVPSIQQVRDEAQRAIAGKAIKDINPLLYQRSEQKAAKAAVAAGLKGDWAAAFQAKQQELLSHELYRAAVAARDEVDGIVTEMARYGKPSVRAKLGKAGEQYLAQVDALLERYNFKPMGPKAAAKRESLLAFVKAQEAAGEQIDIPDAILEQARPLPYREATVDELRGLRDAVRQIAHLARTKNTLLTQREERRVDRVVAAMRDVIGQHYDLERKPDDISGPFAEKLKRGTKRVLAEHTRMEFLFKALDGFKPGGPVWSALFKPMADAENVKNELQKADGAAMEQIMSAYTKKERSAWFTQRFFLPEVKTAVMDGHLTKANMLMVALNWGNQYNRDALMSGYHWSQGQVEAILRRLDARDWKTVQSIWDHIDTHWPAARELEREMTGLAPEKVEALPFSNQHGGFRGGYFPIAFDRDLSTRAATLDERNNIMDAFGGNHAKAMTRHGHLKERTNTGGKPLKLEMSVIADHLSSVTHDLAYRRAVVDAAKLVRQPDFQTAVEAAMGREMYQQLTPWLMAIAGDRQKGFTSQSERLLSRGRSGATVVTLGLKVTSAMVQLLGYANAMNEIGAKYGAKGLASMYANPLKIKENYQFVTERSAMMRDRLLGGYDRDVRELAQKQQMAGHDIGWLQMIGYMDMAVSLPAWLGAYRQAMDGHLDNIDGGDEEGAIGYADSIVRTTQAAGSAMDLAAVQRGGEAWKLFTMFYSSMSVLYNQMQYATQRVANDGNIPRFVASMAMIWFLPAVLEDVLRGRGPGGGGDDDEDKSWWKYLVSKELFYPMGTVVLLRDVANSLDRYVETGKMDFQGSPLFGAVETFLKGAFATPYKAASEDKEVTRADVRNTVMAIGYLTKLPTRQLWQMGDYFYDWMNGDVQPDNALEGVYQAVGPGKPKQ